MKKDQKKKSVKEKLDAELDIANNIIAEFENPTNSEVTETRICLLYTSPSPRD